MVLYILAHTLIVIQYRKQLAYFMYTTHTEHMQSHSIHSLRSV